MPATRAAASASRLARSSGLRSSSFPPPPTFFLMWTVGTRRGKEGSEGSVTRYRGDDAGVRDGQCAVDRLGRRIGPESPW